MLYQVAALVGEAAQGLSRIEAMRKDLARMSETGRRLPKRPKVYFEEWDGPLISGIHWVSELLGVAGGDDIFPELASQSLGKNRIVEDPLEVVRRNPDIIIGSWCGKKFRPANVASRPQWHSVKAVQDAQLHEVKSVEILQPGPAALTDGVRRLQLIIDHWAKRYA